VIDPRYVQTMARYNRWQNTQLMPVLESMPMEELTKDRASFFGGILATANHLLWGDTLWMSRFDPSVDAPKGGIDTSVTLHATSASWGADRFRMDGKICFWADGLRALDLKGCIRWYSRAAGREMTSSYETAIMHFFNHQTHHRGQLHAMLTSAGQKAPVSDLFLMPEDF
jgi:uncharacterized damage-inducible protein DinB